MLHLLSLLLALVVLPVTPLVIRSSQAPQDSAPVVQNPGFECGEGFHDEPGINGMVPNGWTARILKGTPFTCSTQMWATYSCDPDDMGWEKLEGYDSNIFLAQWSPYGEDFVAPSFDIALSQAVDVAPGGEYSLSAWMTSLCGGSADPNCPAGAYIAKMAGLDPTGGTDPLAGTVEWTEDRRSHYEARWANLIVATTAQASTLTVFMRVNSPFTYHGNTAYADAVKLVRSPSSKFTGLGLGFKSISVSWDGSLGPDIPAIPGTKHELSFELQVRTAGGAWQPWLSGQPVGSAAFAPPLAGQGKTYQFRIRAWAIQPPGSHGSWPDHHFVGVWHESAEIYMPVMEERPPVSLFLPLTAR